MKFEKLLKAFREKLGVDVAEEMELALKLDEDALRSKVATKSDDERLVQLAKDMADIKVAIAGLNIGEAVKAAFPKVEVATLEAVEVKTPKDITDFINATTTSIATMQTAINSILTEMAKPPAAQKSEEVTLGINRNEVTQQLIAALTGQQKKADDATQELFGRNAIRWNE